MIQYLYFFLANIIIVINASAQIDTVNNDHKHRLIFTPKDSLGMFQFKSNKNGVYHDSLKLSVKHQIRFTILPGAVRDPIGQTGIAVLPVVTYKLNPKDSISPPSSTSLLAYVSASGSYNFGLQQSLFIKEDLWRFRLYLNTSKYFYDFYGIGKGPSDIYKSTLPIITFDKSNKVTIELFRRIYKRMYIGFKGLYDDFSVDGKTDIDDNSLDSIYIKRGAHRLLSLNPILFWDSRDDIYWSTKGIYAVVSYSNSNSLFNNKDHFETKDCILHYYKKIAKNYVLATRFYFEENTGDVPFSYFSFYGKGLDLRGYVVGRYVNYSNISLQTELRIKTWKYLTTAVFVGTGKSYDKLSRFSKYEWLPSVGAGAYVRLIRNYNLNVNGFVAFGRESWNWYLGIVQSF
jgi:hypothetical protein